MNDLRTLHLLQQIATIAQEGRELDVGLRSSDLPGAAAVADRLAAGDDVVTVMRDLVGPRLAASFAADGPGLAPAAMLAHEELRLRRERRRSLIESLAYPFACMLALTLLMLWLHRERGVRIEWAWWLLAVLPVAPALVLLVPLPAAVSRWLGPFAGWRRHARLAGRYARAAVVASWRLPEGQVHALFGAELDQVLPHLGRRGAEETCMRLAEHHRRAALAGAKRIGFLVTVLLYLSAAGVALMTAAGLWSRLTDEVQATIAEVDEPELWDLRR